MSIFKACDIRGIYKEDLDEEKTFEIGRAFGTMIEGKDVVVGGDVRLSTPSLKKKIIEGLILSGSKVIDIGTLPTPAFYFAKRHLNTYGGVMVTASHNPSKYNGFKIIFGDLPVREEDIEDLEKLTKIKKYRDGKGELITKPMLEEYEKYILRFFHPITKRLKVVIDAGNGVCGPTAIKLFTNLGYDVEPLFCEMDGNFPHREPNPAIEENLKYLKKKVVESNADFGVAFDGDGDRVAFVDEEGRVLSSEKGIIIFAKYLFKKDGAGKIVYDHKCSTVVEKEITKLGGTAIREKSGHAFIKRNFLIQNAIMAGEISGHYFFRELGGDDGIYAALLMGEIIDKKNKKLSELANQIPDYYITPDIRIPYPYEDKEELLNSVKEKFKEYPIDTLDGVRVIFPNGWGLIRISVTEPVITMRFEGDTNEDLRKIKDIFSDAIPELKDWIR
ncbi:Phosphomannomutase [Thermoanaerobacter sp. YS13]|uniref:phosphomannomutase/phosphoglucomutase n=1 Tax=Thermoanaerobacter sp. YS13 TaxID=1511746 RepID=UPI000575D073|nr:phosphomannomutase/phosphoglucomutase [Thermoanaerobacter sp. YS13]KHO61415.1 Phosphomannomutase [Thermoanaerobacter sp. YS13]